MVSVLPCLGLGDDPTSTKGIRAAPMTIRMTSVSSRLKGEMRSNMSFLSAMVYLFLLLYIR